MKKEKDRLESEKKKLASEIENLKTQIMNLNEDLSKSRGLELSVVYNIVEFDPNNTYRI